MGRISDDEYPMRTVEGCVKTLTCLRARLIVVGLQVSQMMVLRKIFPLRIMSEWMEACRPTDVLPTNGSSSDATLHFIVLRWCLHPDEIVGAIAGRAWEEDSEFGGDKCRYMATRGYFDMASDNFTHASWWTSHSRRSIIGSLRINQWMQFYRQAGLCRFNVWDCFRNRHGSPFNSGFDWSALQRQGKRDLTDLDEDFKAWAKYKPEIAD